MKKLLAYIVIQQSILDDILPLSPAKLHYFNDIITVVGHHQEKELLFNLAPSSVRSRINIMIM